MARSQVWRVPVEGGTPLVVGRIPVAPIGLTWASSGRILVATGAELLSFPEGGGEARILARPDSAAGELYLFQPYALPEGKLVLVGAQPIGGLSGTRLAAVSIESGEITRFDLNLLDPLGYLDGSLVYVTPSGSLMAVELDVTEGRIVSGPVALGPTVLTRVSGSSAAALSPAGTLVYQSANEEAQVGWVGPEGSFEPLLGEPRGYGYPRLSPDGSNIAMTIGQVGRSDVWLYHLASATPTRLTSSGTLNDRPEWTPDGTRVLYRADQGSRSAIWWQAADRSTPPEPLQAGEGHDYYEGVITPDGKALVYQVDDAGSSQADVMYRALEGDTTSHPVIATNFAEAQARVSPDGEWVAYATDASGASQVVVRPFPGPGGQVQVSSAGGSEPVWASDGRRIFYRDGQHLVAASVTTEPTFAITGRTALFTDEYVFAQAPHANYDVAADGERLLMVKSVAVPKLTVVYGWRSELQARLRDVNRR